MTGRVEICNNNIWGTVCDDLWESSDAQVACRQLGFTTDGTTVLSSSDVPDGTGQIWLDNVSCQGTETRLIDCPASPLGSHDCGHTEDAGVRCGSTCTQGAIRLQGGTATSGRVEICNNNIWGTVCDDLWESSGAQVACRQLGFTGGATVLSSSDIPDGTGQIWLDNVSCRGTETRLIDCPANPLGSHDCGHGEDAGVRCGSTCTQGAIRLQGGTATSGRVEICNNNIWGTVCDDFWESSGAQVACRQLGFTGGATVLSSSDVPDGTGQIWLDDVSCRGTETRLIDCPANLLGTHDCGHTEDAGVRCGSICTRGAIRLEGGTATSGRVEICNNNVWGTVCDDLWDSSDAQVACRQLGFTGGATVLSSSDVPDGTGQIWLDDVSCRGTETRLIDCPANLLGTHDCGHTEDAGVRCGSICTRGAIRLEGGTATSGRVEICNNNVWGTVCDDLWDSSDAQVACRQLGFTGGATVLSSSDVPDGTGQIWLDDVSCRGTETRLIDCRADPLGTHNCGHGEDAGVQCGSICTQGAIRLEGGTATSGRVEICNNNVWGTVCDDLWGDVDAQVVCRQLGFLSVGATALTSFNVPAGTGQIWLDNVSCRGTETRLIDCPADPLGTHNCGHIEDAGVRCRGWYTFCLELETASAGYNNILLLFPL